ncbi:hypothetical protein ACLI1A_13135 [Flavobacterium sp. RHBU_3]|uniref:hypothetical protein n=1 Tax=Flavobacterium sp. RHBU_3 TaxID=3391184 RepID=UPI0039847B4E
MKIISELPLILSVLSFCISSVTFFFNMRNMDRYGLKKVIFDKKLQIMLEFYERIEKFNFLLFINENGEGYVSIDNIRGHIKSLKNNNTPNSELYIELETYNFLHQNIFNFSLNPFVEKNVYQAALFLSTEYIMKIDIERADFTRIELNGSPGKKTYIHSEDFSTVDEFLRKMTLIQILIEKWIQQNSGVRKVLRK